MNREQVIAKLKAVEPQLRAYGVAALYLFGSYARDDAREDSDLDVFIDKAPGRTFGFDELMGGYYTLKEAVPGIEISLGTRQGLAKDIRSLIENQAVRIF
jgi:predicted nucleotidyltransferase